MDEEAVDGEDTTAGEGTEDGEDMTQDRGEDTEADTEPQVDGEADLEDGLERPTEEERWEEVSEEETVGAAGAAALRRTESPLEHNTSLCFRASRCRIRRTASEMYIPLIRAR